MRTVTPKQAYRRGFRHILDLAEIKQLVEASLDDESDETVMRLVEAWRKGALTATAMLEREHATLQ